MKHSTYLKALKSHKPTPTVRALVEAWIMTGEKIRPCYTTGSGKHTKNSDHTDAVRHFLSVGLKLPWTSGNDAPRGGLTGNWIKPDAPGWGKMKPVRDHFKAEAEAERAKAEAKKQAELQRQAAYYADKLHDHHAVLLAWWEAREFHPAPTAVIAAKHASGLTWKQIRTYCKANTKEHA